MPSGAQAHAESIFIKTALNKWESVKVTVAKLDNGSVAITSCLLRDDTLQVGHLETGIQYVVKVEPYFGNCTQSSTYQKVAIVMPVDIPVYVYISDDGIVLK